MKEVRELNEAKHTNETMNSFPLLPWLVGCWSFVGALQVKENTGKRVPVLSFVSFCWLSHSVHSDSVFIHFKETTLFSSSFCKISHLRHLIFYLLRIYYRISSAIGIRLVGGGERPKLIEQR